jgi:hypothetical protein
MRTLSRKHFSFTVPYEQVFAVSRNFEDPKWDYPKMFMRETIQITSSSLIIAKIIKEKLGIELFPLVFKVATKGWSRGGGTYSFMMYGANAEHFYFDDAACRYKSMRGHYEIHGNVISRVNKKKL